MIRGHRVPESCSCLAQKRYIGTMTTCGGSIIVATTTIIARLRPRKRKWASAYATGMLDTRVRAVPRVAYAMVLRHHVAKPGVRQTSTKLCHSQVWGHRSRVSVCLSVNTDVRNKNTNGRAKNKPTVTANVCTATHSRT